MTFYPKEARALVGRLTFEAVNGEIDKVFAGELGKAITAALDEIERLRATLSAITATDCYSRDECTAMARAALTAGDKP